MKVVCDGCQAKYKLTDGRLAGRTLKFRCRKCGNTILIDGAEFRPSLPQPPRPQRVTDGFAQEALPPFEAAPPEWYLSINSEPYGPCTTEQMASLLCDGQVPWETYVWREGYADWKPASDSNSLVTAAQALLLESGEEGFADYGSQPAESGFEEQDWSAPGGAAPAVYERAHESRPSYEGAFPLSDSALSDDDGSAAFASGFAATARVHEEPTRVAYIDPLTGKSPFGDQETSGLIDIRALSALAGIGRSSSLGVPPREGGDGDERGSGHPDTLAPVDRLRSPRSRAVPFAILSGSALIAAATFVAIYSSSATTKGSAMAANGVPEDAPIAESEPAPAAAPSGAAAPQPAPAPVPAAEVHPSEPAAPAKPHAGSSKPAASRSSERVDEGKPAKPTAPAFAAPDGAGATPANGSAHETPHPDANPYLQGDETAEAPKKPAATGANRSLDELLDEAIPKDDAEPASTPAARHPRAGDPALPETPSRDQVVAAMRAIEPDVRACVQGQTLETPTAAASFTVLGATGHVGNVRVTAVQGPVNACIVRAIHNAIFPEFAKGQLRINYPLRLGP